MKAIFSLKKRTVEPRPELPPEHTSWPAGVVCEKCEEAFFPQKAVWEGDLAGFVAKHEHCGKLYSAVQNPDDGAITTIARLARMH